ncbi:exported hypothetical protein [Gammaproteobacteria bacterium]
MLKKNLLFLLLLSFISCCAWADEVKEPRIIKINNYLLVYEDVAEKIIKHTKCNKIVKESDDKIRICDNDPLVKEIIMLYKKAESMASDNVKRRFWVFNDKEDTGINFDREKKLIVTLILPE